MTQSNSESLAGRRTIVTGAAGRIGKEIARSISSRGAQVMLVDRDSEKLSEVASELADLGSKVAYCQADVGDQDQVDRMVDRTIAEIGGVDSLVTSAGISIPNAALDMPVEDFDLVLRVNLRGTFLCAQATARHMIANQTPGSIVTISSTLAFSGMSRQAQYVASKAGVIALTKNLAIEWGHHRIRVNCVAPGMIDTPLTSVATERPDEYAKRTPLGRIGEPGDVAKVTRFLLSEDAGYVTGQTIAVNGGHSMPS